MTEDRGDTTTLLFTDIEDSTGLARELGDEWSRVLAQHRSLLRTAAWDAGGHEVDCRADDFLGLFERPADAVRAALAAQRALRTHEWPSGADVRVRMGIHMGRPAIGEAGYVGVDVHRAVRVGNAGHGGQVLLSEAAARTVGPAPVDDATLRDLGEHRLAGLPEPERIFQLVVSDLPADFPVLRTPAREQSDGLRVVLAEDSVLLREGVARILSESGFQVVGQAGNAEELLLKVRSYSPDVAIIDIRMPPTHTDEGLRAAKEIRERHPGTGVLVLSQYVEPDYAMELLAESAEGVGYLLKDRVSDVTEFAAAVRRVAEGGSALDPSVVSQLVGRRGGGPLADLTPREREVLELMAEGRSNSGIAERLVVTERAVEKHVTSIFSKLRLPAAPEDHRRVLAVLAFLHS